MIICKQLEKYKDKSGKIVGYRLVDQAGVQTQMKSEDLKAGIKAGNLKVVNLTLTKDGRLVDGAEPKAKAIRNVTNNIPSRKEINKAEAKKEAYKILEILEKITDNWIKTGNVIYTQFGDGVEYSEGFYSLVRLNKGVETCDKELSKKFNKAVRRLEALKVVYFTEENIQAKYFGTDFFDMASNYKDAKLGEGYQFHTDNEEFAKQQYADKYFRVIEMFLDEALDLEPEDRKELGLKEDIPTEIGGWYTITEGTPNEIGSQYNIIEDLSKLVKKAVEYADNCYGLEFKHAGLEIDLKYVEKYVKDKMDRYKKIWRERKAYKEMQDSINELKDLLGFNK